MSTVGSILAYVAAAILVVWGTAHIIIPTGTIVRRFGPLSEDNRRILTMEWVAEGLALCFLGILSALVTALSQTVDPTARLVLRAVAAMAVVMGVWTLVIGSRTSDLAIKLCPLVYGVSAILLALGSIV